MSKISLLSIIVSIWLTLIGLLAVYAVSAFVFMSLSDETGLPPFVVQTFTAEATILAVFGVVTCLAAGKQLRNPEPRWVLAAIGLGVAFFAVHLMSTVLILAPKIDIKPVADFAIETAWDQLIVGPAVVLALFALPLAYNLLMRRTPS